MNGIRMLVRGVCGYGLVLICSVRRWLSAVVLPAHPLWGRVANPVLLRPAEQKTP